MNGRRGLGLGGFGRWRSAFDLAVGVGRKCMNRAMTSKATAISTNMVADSLLLFALIANYMNELVKMFMLLW
jgi:hypothetical protein